MKRALCWIRRDLRLHDHRALARACEMADEVAVVFVFDTTILGALEDRDDRRVTFIHRSLEELNRKLGGRLVVRHGDPVEEIPRLAREWGAEVVVAAQDFEASAIARDLAVSREVSLELVTDHVVLPGDSVLNQQGLPFRVFTPYSKGWRSRVSELDLAASEADLSKLSRVVPPSVSWSLGDLGFQDAELWLGAGEDAGRARLAAFRADRYAEARDFPALNATSGLSVHLRFGTVSVREAFAHAAGHAKWETELIWREFYSMLLSQFPEVETGPFQAHYRGMVWPGDPAHYKVWEAGQTGYPIVDAAMRCLNQTGWMHNRLRMIVASFLTKDLLLDYRLGEAWFARKLLDFDLASNVGGWQWAASVGCDAQPYFRIFNPYLQSRKFDPEGVFIREWVPELASLDATEIHDPGPLLRGDYPMPMVSHEVMRDKAVAFLGSFQAKA